MPKKIIIDQKPKAPRLPREIAHGKRNAISRSKIMNKIATNKILHQIPFLSHQMPQIHIHKQIIFQDQD